MTVCMFDGTLGNSGRIKVTPFTGLFNQAHYIYGIATQSINAGEDGYITIDGKVRNVDTTGALVGEVWVDGDVLYAKPNDAGRLTKVTPADNELRMPIASVVHAHTNGTLEVRVLPFNENMIAKRADKWTTARTITLSGDVSGSASVDGSANVTITTTVQPNSVALGTDTTGNYMVDITAGSGISVSHTQGEGSTATITNSAPNVTTDITTTHTSTNVVVNSSDGTDGTINSATQMLAGVMSAVDKTKLDGIEAGATGDQTASEILTLLKTVDGSGSGVDADLLDGQEGAYYLNASHINTGTLALDRLPTIPNTKISGLGTASTRNVGTGAGNVMEVGAFGIGRAAYGDMVINDFNNILTAGASGIYRGSNTALNKPTGAGGDGSSLLRLSYDSNTENQLLFPSGYDDNNFYLRSRTFDNYSEWRKITHSGNLLTSTGQSTEYPMTQKAVTDALNSRGAIAGSNTANGYVKLDNGLIIQWGTTGTTATIFPIAFPNAGLQVVVQINYNVYGTFSGQDVYVSGITQTGFSRTRYAAGCTWIAIGY